MTTRCFPLVGGRVLRATRLDVCGRPEYGDCAQVVSEGFVSIATTANVDDGEEISVTNANGKKCVRQPAKPTLDGYTHVITFCDVEPDLYALMTGQEVVYDDAGDAVGFRVDTAVSPADHAWALEVWSNVPGVACTDEGEGIWGYMLWPFLSGGVLGDFTIENAAVSFQIQGVNTMTGVGWGTGPYPVVTGGTGAGQLLTPLDRTDVLHVQLTDVPPPEPGVDCGCLPLDNPAWSSATGADAGTPGTWTPADSRRPATFDALATSVPAITANPTTVWSTGQHVVLGDGAFAWWDGTDWQEGTAP